VVAVHPVFDSVAAGDVIAFVVVERAVPGCVIIIIAACDVLVSMVDE